MTDNSGRTTHYVWDKATDSPVPRDDQDLIRDAPEPLRRLGERLADLLDSDHWNNIEPLLLEIAAQNEQHRTALDKIATYGERHMSYVNCMIDGMALSKFARAALGQSGSEKS